MKYVAIILLTSMLWLGSIGLCAAEGWNPLGWNSWNPLDREDESDERVAARVSDGEQLEDEDAAFSFPWSERRRALSDAAQRRSRRDDQPSVWARMNQGTRSFFGKAKRAVTPWDDDEDRTASRTRRRPIDNSRESSFFGTLFESGQEDQGVDTVPEFLNLPRPMP